jgi:hypothetical protein
VYSFVPREQIAETLIHLRGLFREIPLSNEKDYRAQERREILTKNLLSNLFRTKAHPTLHAVLEVADAFSLTLDGAHRLFGYELERIREYDLKLNAGRTHDPEMCFELGLANGPHLDAFYYRNDYVGVEQWSRTIARGNYVYLVSVHQQHGRFAKVWDNNLRLQGFAEACMAVLLCGCAAVGYGADALSCPLRGGKGLGAWGLLLLLVLDRRGDGSLLRPMRPRFSRSCSHLFSIVPEG